MQKIYHKRNELLEVEFYQDKDCKIPFDFTYQDQNEPYDWQYEYNFEILGRPITLEDILLLLKGYFAGIHVDINGIFKLNGIGQPADWSIIGWNFTKPLHEQTSQVWENISKLIG